MENNQSSRTALLAACCRSYHAAHDEPKIFDDFVVSRLLTKEECALFEQQTTMALQFVNPELAALSPDRAYALDWMVKNFMPLPLVVSRARYMEDCLHQASKAGVRQYIILGAGMDTFAFRCPEMLKQIQVTHTLPVQW